MVIWLPGERGKGEQRREMERGEGRRLRERVREGERKTGKIV